VDTQQTADLENEVVNRYSIVQPPRSERRLDSGEAVVVKDQPSILRRAILGLLEA
jgi:hypothetical protein